MVISRCSSPTHIGYSESPAYRTHSSTKKLSAIDAAQLHWCEMTRVTYTDDTFLSVPEPTAICHAGFLAGVLSRNLRSIQWLGLDEVWFADLRWCHECYV